jgi:hypothetical protein
VLLGLIVLRTASADVLLSGNLSDNFSTSSASASAPGDTDTDSESQGPITQNFTSDANLSTAASVIASRVFNFGPSDVQASTQNNVQVSTGAGGLSVVQDGMISATVVTVALSGENPSGNASSSFQMTFSVTDPNKDFAVGGSATTVNAGSIQIELKDLTTGSTVFSENPSGNVLSLSDGSFTPLSEGTYQLSYTIGDNESANGNGAGNAQLQNFDFAVFIPPPTPEPAGLSLLVAAGLLLRRQRGG